MKATSVTYEIRLTLGQYQHEQLSCTVEAETGKEEDPDKMMQEARRVCIANSTNELKKAKNG
jgi:hypothetical protein